ncbi:adenylosuccinate lyase [Enterobacteriaceae endosymbiont of Plateumaris pusilla]|uniref:adenylosuccinate lyase n=1 Tax=Enterobacteriaceae endosymbiont of Plateumaris pusilla TaxID=2675795 RepID=UPI001448D472|nr:adenylosuccinate lyase [Enterobacteriaceae endosymbiont of Plateumaris pusilla]QJC29715.1 adenylosuccinate lyase [Enterobacteriaceae endosymbiont of Plateumaris pusilla]
MKLFHLNALSPLDGRYHNDLVFLKNIFSEYSLMKFRLEIEISWLKFLSKNTKINEISKFSIEETKFLNEIISNFNEFDALKIKKIEYDINHDVKAIEYFLKNKIKKHHSLKKISEFVHFACTSEDINNLSYAIMLNISKNNLLSIWINVMSTIKKLSLKYNNIAMLSHTHGQPATPSTIGKEMINYVYRMKLQINKFKKINILGKINGAVGNYNAHKIAYPNIDWHKLSKTFVESLEITWNPYTTQIEPHDYIAEIFHCIIRFNNILIDFNRDIWGYISLKYFNQKFYKKHIGSSTMPHKINPILFEKSEGNLGMSNAIMQHMANKLPISRWQRDLTDSTVMRNIGVAIGYSIVSYTSTIKGIKQLKINKNFLKQELEENWQVIGEAIQTIMKKYNIKNAYEKIKELTRGKNISSQNIHDFINKLNIPNKEKLFLKNITPNNYIGYAIELTNNFNKYV